MADALRTVSPRGASTPISEKAKSGQKRNTDGGGFAFVLDDLARARRFLILGSDGSFYKSGQEMSKDNATVIIRLAKSEDSAALVDLIVQISLAGRAPKQNPALFALAIASTHGTDDAKKYARSQVSKVARTSTHLFLYVTYYLQFAGWGRGLRGVVASWYTSKTVDQAAYQMVKYQSREGLSHKRLLATSHVKHPDAAFNGLARWVRRGDTEDLPKLVKGFMKAHKDGADIPALVRKYGLSWEMVPTEALKSTEVWEALLDGNVPLGALLRQISRLTRIGVIKPMGGGLTKVIVKRLTDREELKRARLHPLQILIAQRQYASGRSDKGTSTWTPVREVTEALEEAFYAAFDFVEPTGLRFFQALDVSPSMTGARLGSFNIMASEAAAAMVLLTLKTEPYTFVGGFSTEFVPLSLNKNMSLSEAWAVGARHHYGATNIGAAIQYAMDNGIETDVFIVYTDNEGNRGAHPFELLKKYRAKTGIDAKLIVLAMTATRYTIADPDDPGMLDIVGFDTAVPSLVAEFAAGL